MKIDNEKLVEKVQALKVLYAVIIITIIGVFFTTSLELYTIKYIGLSKQGITLVLGLAYLAYYIYHLLAKTAYLFYSDEGKKIVIRFYLLRPINPKKNSIEIFKNQFYKYSIIRKPLSEEVVVYQRDGNKILKYPPFSISGLTKEEKRKLFESLDLYVQNDGSTN